MGLWGNHSRIVFGFLANCLIDVKNGCLPVVSDGQITSVVVVGGKLCWVAIGSVVGGIEDGGEEDTKYKFHCTALLPHLSQFTSSEVRKGRN